MAEVFRFAAGAVVGFTAPETVATRGFTRRPRGERPEVVALGSSLGFFSVAFGLGAAALCDALIEGSVAGPLGSLLATLVYLVLVAVEMLFARSAGWSSVPNATA